MLSEISQAEKDNYRMVYTHLWNIRDSAEVHRGREGKLNGKKSERGTNHERLWTLGNKLRASERRGWGIGIGQ